MRLHDKSLLPTLMALLLLGSGVSLVVGAMSIGWKEALMGLLHWQWPTLLASEVEAQYAQVLGEVRLPRLLLGLSVGATLGLCGAVMQGLFRNPLADPAIIGVSSGAAFGAALALVFSGYFISVAGLWLQSFSWALLPLCASVGAGFATWLAYRLGNRGRSVVMMLLAGVAITAVAGAGLGLLQYIANDSALRDIAMWQLGSLTGASWSAVALSTVVLFAAGGFLWRRHGELNALLLGEAEASHLGVDTLRLKKLIILLSAIAMGTAVSVAGLIGFVGLVVPHIVRLLRGPDHRFLLPYSALTGAILLVLADILARILVAPAEIPVGILTALLGAPFFIFLLHQQRRQFV
ncbi:MAG: iron ABC transporter permease [Gammaproteobacteria bacterium]|nr:iron ABC transporter permease [Gammaproteobacteria bacterium]